MKMETLMSTRWLPLMLIVSFVIASCEKKIAWQAHPAESVPSTANSSKAEELWTCPMHPQIREKAAGTCPICGMKLIPMESVVAESAAISSTLPEGHAAFSLTPQRQQMIGVKTGYVERKNVFMSIEAAGRMAFDPDLYTAQSEYLEALDQLNKVKSSPIAEAKHSAARMVDSTKLRLKVLGLSDEQIKAMQQQGAAAPNLFSAGTGEHPWIYADVFEMDLPHIKSGLSASISGGVLANKTAAGKVVAVDRLINPTTRTAKVRIQLLNDNTHLRPESYVNVTIHVPLGTQTTVPFDAVFDTGKEAWVYVFIGHDTFEPRLITIAERVGSEVIIASGLKEGEKIVTSANFLIDSESRLKGVQAAANTDSSASSSTSKQSEHTSEPVQNLPKCPKGQFWHQEMKHCMPEIGK